MTLFNTDEIDDVVANGLLREALLMYMNFFLLKLVVAIRLSQSYLKISTLLIKLIIEGSNRQHVIKYSVFLRLFLNRHYTV